MADAKALANCVHVAENGQTFAHVHAPPKPKKLSLGLNLQGLSAVGHSDEGRVPQPQLIPPPPPPTRMDFIVKSSNEADPIVRYHMARNGPLFMVYNDYAEKLGYTRNDIMIRRETQFIGPLETPGNVALGDAEALTTSPRVNVVKFIFSNLFILSVSLSLPYHAKFTY